jgi:hypothetical protein
LRNLPILDQHGKSCASASPTFANSIPQIRFANKYTESARKRAMMVPEEEKLSGRIVLFLPSPHDVGVVHGEADDFVNFFAGGAGESYFLLIVPFII